MALSVTRARVKEKCSISTSSYDATIDNLISELVPAISFAIRDEHLADTGNTGLQATLNLAAAEIVCGEILEQTQREQGAMEKVRLGDFELWPPSPKDWIAVLAIKDSGWKRLAPYLKADASGRKATTGSSGGKLSAGDA